MQKFLTTREAAEFLRIQPQTLRMKRMKKEGPRFIKVPSTGKNPRVLYELNDLRTYLGLDNSEEKK